MAVTIKPRKSLQVQDKVLDHRFAGGFDKANAANLIGHFSQLWLMFTLFRRLLAA
ncbi:hypothetical protein [Marivita sp.]|uniref:hypothetical protein n=1 Tax=Marivita sp. TaxID=2003365 RepID=UPI002630698C|nr:hypothetical protein [Marivita sp.]